ncbi:RNA polymerase sigma factor [Caproiciproducens sp.]
MILGYLKHLPDFSVCNAFYTVLGIIKIQQDALDIIQESYITAFSKLDTLKENASFISWLKIIIVNNCKKKLKV